MRNLKWVRSRLQQELSDRAWTRTACGTHHDRVCREHPGTPVAWGYGSWSGAAVPVTDGNGGECAWIPTRTGGRSTTP